jgi:polysaccharide deacetylase 2 family uncharacterized protein YibQ
LLEPLVATKVGPAAVQEGTGVHPEGAEAAMPAPPTATEVAASRDTLPQPAEPPVPDGPLIAVMLTELGPNAPAAEEAIARLPAGISLSFSPYPDASRALARKAKEDGHEVWLSVPMQPRSYPRVSPGPHVLLTANSGDENVGSLEWALGRIDAAVGITNMMGSAFTEDADAMRPVLAELKARNLDYIDARSSGRSVGEREALALGLDTATNDRFIDEPETSANIRRSLDILLATAKRRGYAIGYARPVPATIEALERWTAQLAEEGVTLVDASIIARKNSDD